MIDARQKSLFLATMAVVATSAYLASLESTAQILGRQSLLTVTGAIALGPVAGWIFAARDGHLLTALWSLLPATVLSVGPLLLWLRVPNGSLLAIAAMVWVLSGYFYSVAMWI